MLKEKSSTAENMAANGVYISPVGEGRLEAGREVRVELIRGEDLF